MRIAWPCTMQQFKKIGWRIINANNFTFSNIYTVICCECEIHQLLILFFIIIQRLINILPWCENFYNFVLKALLWFWEEKQQLNTFSHLLSWVFFVLHFLIFVSLVIYHILCFFWYIYKFFTDLRGQSVV